MKTLPSTLDSGQRSNSASFRGHRLENSRNDTQNVEPNLIVRNQERRNHPDNLRCCSVQATVDRCTNPYEQDATGIMLLSSKSLLLRWHAKPESTPCGVTPLRSRPLCYNLRRQNPFSKIPHFASGFPSSNIDFQERGRC